MIEASVERVVPARVPQPARPRRRLPPTRPRDDAQRCWRRSSTRCSSRRGFRMQPVGGRVGRGCGRLPDRAGLQRRARRAPAQAGGGAPPADADRDRDRRATVSRRATSSSSSPRATDRPGRRLRRPERGRAGAGGCGGAARSGRPHARARGARAGGNRGRGSLPARACSRPSSSASARGTTPKQDALAEAREPAFWQSEERHEVLSLIEYLDRLGAATATAERLAARLSSRARGPLTRARATARDAPARAHGRARRPRRAGGERRDDHGARGEVRGHGRLRPCSWRSSRRCTSAGRMAAGCGCAGTVTTASSCSRSPGSAPTRC